MGGTDRPGGRRRAGLSVAPGPVRNALGGTGVSPVATSETPVPPLLPTLQTNPSFVQLPSVPARLTGRRHAGVAAHTQLVLPPGRRLQPRSAADAGRGGRLLATGV